MHRPHIYSSTVMLFGHDCPTQCIFKKISSTLHSKKKPGSDIVPGRVHWGQTPFRVKDDPEISQLDAECDPELGQSDLIICQVCRKLTNFRVIFDPEWSLAPMDPFPDQADPGVLRVYV